MTQLQVESLTRSQQLYQWLLAVDPATTVSQLKFESLPLSIQLFYIYEALGGASVTQRWFESHTLGQQLYLIYTEVEGAPISQRLFESFSFDLQLYYIYSSTATVPIEKEEFLSLTRGQQIWYISENTSSSPFVSFSDDFERDNAATLGSNWTDVAGGHSISINSARSVLPGFAKNVSIYNQQTNTLNQFIKITYISNGAVGSFVGPVFRYKDANSGVYIIDWSSAALYWGYYPDMATVSGGDQRNIINGAAFAPTTGQAVASTMLHTGANTRLRIWLNATGTVDAGGVTWNGVNPDINQLIDAGLSADEGKGLGIDGFQSSPQAVIGDFSGGDVPDGSSLLDNYLVGAWNLDQASGPRLNHYLGSNHLSDGNTVLSLVDGVHGVVADFESSNNESLSLNNNTSIQAGDVDFACSVWVNLETKASSMTIIGKPSSGSVLASEWFVNWNQTTDRFEFSVFQGAATVVTVQANNLGSPVLGTWYNIVVMHDSVNNIISIRVNNGTPNTAAFSGGTNATISPFSIGSIESAIQFFDGQMCKAFFWKGRILTSDEITYLATGAKYPFLT